MRLRIFGSVLASITLIAAGLAPVAAAEGDEVKVTLLATTDPHGHVYNWDYFRDAPYAAGKELGMARVHTIVKDIRAANSANSVVVVDNGDSIQGTPLTYLAAVQPEKLGIDKHPMAIAFNTIGYDAQIAGNHEFNYGLDLLKKYQGQINAPLLAANAVKHGTDEPAFTPYTIVKRTIDGHEVKIGILGLVTPGVRVWDKALVAGKLEFKDVVETAQKYVPQMKAAGADVVVAVAHTGQDPKDAVWNPKDLGENVARTLATKVNDIDVVVAGHSHVENGQEMFTAPDGDPVLLTQPKFWAQSVSEVSIKLVKQANGSFKIKWDASASKVHPTAPAADSPEFLNNPELKKAHDATVAYVNTVVAQSTERMTTDTSRYEDTPILDLIGHVMTEAVKKGLQGKPEASLPIIAQVSPFSRTSVFPKGDVTIKDIAGLYIYDNTLSAVKINGAQLKKYLEYSARYFCQVPAGGSFDPARDAGCIYPGLTRPIPDYNFDAITGVNYNMNVSKPVGERIEGLKHTDGTAIKDTDEFILAVNNYRQNGGGDYPEVSGAPEVWNDLVEIRQAIIEWAQKKGTINPADFFVHNWNIVVDKAGSGVSGTLSFTGTGSKLTTPVLVRAFNSDGAEVARTLATAGQDYSLKLPEGTYTVRVTAYRPFKVVGESSKQVTVKADAMVDVDWEITNR